MAQWEKNLPANAGDARDEGSVPGWGRSPGVGNGNHLQYSSLGNPINRGAWPATVHGVAESDMTGINKTSLKMLNNLCRLILPLFWKISKEYGHCQLKEKYTM